MLNVMTAYAPCPKCEIELVAYAQEHLELDDDILVRFCHDAESETDCDGYFQCRYSDFAEYDVIEDDR